MGCRWPGKEQGHRAAATGQWAALALLSSGADRWMPARAGLRRRLAWPGAAGQTAASAPQAPAGSGGSGPGRGWEHCVSWGLKSPTALGSRHPTLVPRSWAVSTCTGQAAPSPKAQMVWPSICLLISHSESISAGRASPRTKRAITLFIQSTPAATAARELGGLL